MIDSKDVEVHSDPGCCGDLISPLCIIEDSIINSNQLLAQLFNPHVLLCLPLTRTEKL